MNIIKLNYKDKKTAITDLLDKEVYVEVKDLNDEPQLTYGKGTQAVVEIGKIVLENGIYDADFNEVIAPVFANGYKYDVMSVQDIDFGSNEVYPKNPKHTFAGY